MKMVVEDTICFFTSVPSSFTWRYFFKLGFLDGKPGLVWHFLQCGWYRFLVDAKIYEINHRVKGYELCATHPTYALTTGVSAFSARKEQKKEIIAEILKKEYGIEF